MTSRTGYDTPKGVALASMSDSCAAQRSELLDGAELCDFDPDVDPTTIRSVTSLVGALAKERDLTLADWFRPLVPHVDVEARPDVVFREVYKQLTALKELRERNEDLHREVSSLRRDFVMLDTDRAQMISQAVTREERLRSLELERTLDVTVCGNENSVPVQRAIVSLAPADVAMLDNATVTVVRAAYLAFFVLAVLAGTMLLPMLRGLINL